MLTWCAGPLVADDASMRNAVFNGDFDEGVAAWSKLGPGYDQAELVAEKQQFAHVLINELVVSSPRMQRTFTVYNTYLLDVRQGGEYSMTIQASGTGQFSFGAFATLRAYK
jgi:3-mercaptopyruvate sulfurtransferase SseA